MLVKMIMMIMTDGVEFMIVIVFVERIIDNGCSHSLRMKRMLMIILAGVLKGKF